MTLYSMKYVFKIVLFFRGGKQESSYCAYITLGGLVGKEIDYYISDCKLTDRLNLCHRPVYCQQI